jgi:hypothetical protein
MSNEIENISADDAQKALESVGRMEGAGWRRAVPDRWFGAGVAALIGSQFALYALQDPYPYIIFPILGLAIFITTAREKSGAYGRDFPSSKRNVWAMAVFIVVLVVVFFGSIFIRRTFDAAWVSIAAGLMVALVVYLASENERRAYLAKTGRGENK